METAEHKKLKSCIHPKELIGLNFKEAVSIFYEKSMKFRRYFKCLTLTKRPDEDWIDYVTRINENFEQSDIISTSSDHFKYLLFFFGLWDLCCSKFRVRLLNLIEKNYDIILWGLGDECRRIDTVQDDTAMILHIADEHGC
ncbi:unnamed protein product [Hymenolepis diminuta]|uniref:Uncharacterized protein n=1 Tax=Hymenolepis diminuta TaxID=6216 RepID=A0A564ZB74_HYMDI|nr:unnamed protein product [Hymenolepis diminuta]